MNDLMNDFDKKNIFLTVKNEDLETEIYSLNEVEKVRKDENFSAKYMAGIYGGSPNIKGVA